VNCDGRCTHELPGRSTLLIERADQPVSIARPHPVPFGERLIAKFQLPVRSWRERGRLAEFED